MRNKSLKPFSFFLEEHIAFSWQKHTNAVILIIILPLYLWEELCFKYASGLQSFWNLSSEQVSFLGHVYEDVPHNFTKVHATAHFLVSTIRKKKHKSHTWLTQILQMHHLKCHESQKDISHKHRRCFRWEWTERFVRMQHLCFPGLRENSSTVRSYSVLISSRQSLSPKAPHSMLTHICPSSPSTISMFLISSM